MKVAVVTPYYRETDDILRTCLDSVRDQTHAECRHILVADGFPNSLVDRYAATHVRLPTAHGDNGNLGRCIGAFTAIAEGFDAIAFLDADNWYRPDHIARLVALQARTGASVCTSGRSVHRMDGTLLLTSEAECDGVAFADTSCLCVFPPAYDVLALWGTMPRETAPVCDRIMWEAIKLRGINRAHDPMPTVAFRSQYADHYRQAGETPPANAKTAQEARNAIAAVIALPLMRRLGMMLGLGGVDDLAALSAAHAKPATRSQFVNLNAQGRAVKLELPDNEGVRGVVDEIFNERPYRVVPGLPPPRAVLDIGANVGIAAAWFRFIYPDAALICVEPDAATYALLERNAASIGNCLAIHLGLHHGTQVRAVPLEDDGGILNSARMLLIDAETFVAGCNRQDIDLIKIDAAGSEVSILLSLRQRLTTTNVILIDSRNDTDRRLIDDILNPTHFPWHARNLPPHRGTLCYVNRMHAPSIPADTPAGTHAWQPTT